MSENTNESKKNIRQESNENEAEVKNNENNENNIEKANIEKNNKDEKITANTTKKDNENEIKNKKEKKIKEKKSISREIIEWVVCVIIAFSLALFIKYYLFTPTLVMQQSMTPTILNGERVLINRLPRTFGWAFERGDIITFEAPIYSEVPEGGIKALYYDRENIIESFLYNVMDINKTSYIKRVIGVAGDKVRIENGSVYVNDELQAEEYLQPNVKTYISEGGMPSEFIVPEGYIFAMGDNRGGSTDCRVLGCIPISKVEGRVTTRIWPLEKFGKIDK